MHVRTRTIGAAASAAALVVLSGAPAIAHECVNANKQPGAGAQLIIDASTDEVVWVSRGLQSRIDRGIVDFETGEGFSGLVGLDFDGDGKADITTWIVGPEGEIPTKAQFNGKPCQGVTNIGTWFEECFGA